MGDNGALKSTTTWLDISLNGLGISIAVLSFVQFAQHVFDLRIIQGTRNKLRAGPADSRYPPLPLRRVR